MNKLGKCHGLGGCSEVFGWGDDKVIKLFRSNTSKDAASIEFRNSVAVWNGGFPVARPYELIELDGRPGIIFEKIKGETIKDRFFAEPPYDHNEKFDDQVSDMRVMARLLYELHTKSVPDILTNQRDELKRSICAPASLTEDEKKEIIAYLNELPSQNQLCHGDPNPGNVMMRDGKPVMIDWMGASMGNPIADIAEFIIIIKYYFLPPETPSIYVDRLHASRDLINETFLDEYMKLSGLKYSEIDAWILPIAARRLSADTLSEEEKVQLIHVIRQRLNKG